MGSSLREVCEAYWLATQTEAYGLAEWVADQRDAGRTWRAINVEIVERTAGVVDVPMQTLLAWYAQTEAA